MSAADRVSQIEAEMARFEREISGAGQPVAPHPGGNMGQPMEGGLPIATPPGQQAALRFIPHSIKGPPPPPNFPGMMPPLPPPMGFPPSMGFPGQGPQERKPIEKAGPVIEAGPTRYAPPGAATAAGSGVTMPITRMPVPPQPMDLPTSSNAAAFNPFLAVQERDMELVRIKKQNQEAEKNTYIGQVLSGKLKPKRFIRVAGGQKWEDSSLAEWDPNDYRLFCGDLGNEVNDELLAKVFRKFGSFQKARIIRDTRTNKTKGYGFVSFKDPQDYVKAMREMNGKYVGNRPIKLRKSNWKDRDINTVRKKTKEKKKMGLKI